MSLAAVLVAAAFFSFTARSINGILMWIRGRLSLVAAAIGVARLFLFDHAFVPLL